ncbi:lipase family protein [Mycobacterium sp. M23085]|uniref:lipase family protein n=1 Tax=Mycobacterium sp. M23085 TaxID=3378087 RepID=UPI003877B928
MSTQSAFDLTKAIQFAQLVNATYATPPSDLTNAAGQSLSVGGVDYTVVTTIYANDLATDMNPSGADDEVSIGLICQVNKTGDVAVAIRGTEGWLEWIHDADFLQVPCPFLAGAGHTEDGFTDMYESLRTGVAPASPTVVNALATLPVPQPMASLSICGHSLGGALATLLALDMAANTAFTNPTVYTYGSPRTGDSLFAATYDQVVKNSYRVANRLDIVPALPPPLDYEHVLNPVELNPVRLVPPPPEVLVKYTVSCEHSLATYAYLLSLQSGGPVLPLEAACKP